MGKILWDWNELRESLQLKQLKIRSVGSNSQANVRMRCSGPLDASAADKNNAAGAATAVIGRQDDPTPARVTPESGPADTRPFVVHNKKSETLSF
jgi:hypothetical protein